jgi:hypothetical protein
MEGAGGRDTWGGGWTSTRRDGIVFLGSDPEMGGVSTMTTKLDGWRGSQVRPRVPRIGTLDGRGCLSG